MNQALIEAIRDQNAILFVGSGVSQNLGLPSWGALIRHLGEELDYDPELFSAHGDYLSLAEYYQLEKGSIGPLRNWMDREWHHGVDLAASDIHRLIVELKFPIIYTTNYDAWLERAHELYGKEFTKVTGVDDFYKVKPGVSQVVKFHGDFDDKASIVLTESDYFDRLDFEAPLDIKLRHDLLGRTALFIGYSLTDVNIRYMLFRLNQQWKAATIADDARPRSFIFLSRPNPIQERILEHRGIEPIVSDNDNAGDGLREFLQELLKEAYGGT